MGLAINTQESGEGEGGGGVVPHKIDGGEVIVCNFNRNLVMSVAHVRFYP